MSVFDNINSYIGGLNFYRKHVSTAEDIVQTD